MEEERIKQIVRSEIATVFTELRIDIGLLKGSIVKMEDCNSRQTATMARIERYLIGDKELNDIGLAERARFSYEYARKNTESKIVERAEIALVGFTWFTDNKPTLMDMLDKYKIIKALFIFSGITGLISIINLTSVLLDLLGKINK